MRVTMKDELSALKESISALTTKQKKIVENYSKIMKKIAKVERELEKSAEDVSSLLVEDEKRLDEGIPLLLQIYWHFFINHEYYIHNNLFCLQWRRS